MPDRRGRISLSCHVSAEEPFLRPELFEALQGFRTARRLRAPFRRASWRRVGALLGWVGALALVNAVIRWDNGSAWVGFGLVVLVLFVFFRLEDAWFRKLRRLATPVMGPDLTVPRDGLFQDMGLKLTFAKQVKADDAEALGAALRAFFTTHGLLFTDEVTRGTRYFSVLGTDSIAYVWAPLVQGNAQIYEADAYDCGGRGQGFELMRQLLAAGAQFTGLFMSADAQAFLRSKPPVPLLGHLEAGERRLAGIRADVDGNGGGVVLTDRRLFWWQVARDVDAKEGIKVHSVARQDVAEVHAETPEELSISLVSGQVLAVKPFPYAPKDEFLSACRL